jgi:8-oxo-dGTP diphosphatase
LLNLVHRNKKASDIHEEKWNGLGGKFEKGETPEECVVREVLEESGMSIQNPKYL